MRCYLSAKLHGLCVTACELHYQGSVVIDSQLLAKVGIEPYERVFVVNLNTGSRWDTYAIAGSPGEFSLNGGGARLGDVGDRCIVMAFQWSDVRTPATVVQLDEENIVTDVFLYR
jgi:aspartate 1-decarboxylase